MLRETLLAAGVTTRTAKETVAAAVSLGNACPYCVEIQSATLHGLARSTGLGGQPPNTPSRQDALAVAAGRIESITDPASRDLAAWARASGRQETGARHPALFPAGHVPELTGVAVTFHYLNRMVNVFLRDSPLPPSVPAAARGGVRRVLGRLMGHTARNHPAPGAALHLLPDAPLPPDLSWAAASPSIAAAFARGAAAIETAASQSVPQPVRDLLSTTLVSWNGQPPGLGRSWAEDPVSALPAAHRPAARLALLTALASYQVTQSDIDEFRLAQPHDRALIELTAWASLAAARRIGTWIPAPRE
jgi:AhpD family alkylhydroperoxidase